MAEILTIADSLKGLYEKLGGNPSDVEDTSTVTEMIQEITEVAGGGSGGGGELPAITSADKGKVLTVDSNGEWAAEMPSGTLIPQNTVIFTLNEQMQVVNSSISYADMIEAIDNWFDAHPNNERYYVEVVFRSGELSQSFIADTTEYRLTPEGDFKIRFEEATPFILSPTTGIISSNTITWNFNTTVLNGWDAENYPVFGGRGITITGSVTEY